MRSIRTLARAVAVLSLAPTVASSQALISVTSLYVTYNTRKVTTNPTGELKARIDSVDRDLQVASRLGRTGEVRRLLAKGNALLSNRPWTDAADFNASLLLRSDRVVVESQKPYTVRIEQLFSPAIELSRSLSAHATLTSRPTGGAPNQPAVVVKDLGRFDGVSRDLRESPFAMEFDLRDVPDGRYTLVVDLTDSSRALGSATLGLMVKKGIDETVSRLEVAAKRAPDALRAEILYPVDRMRNVNRGRLELRTWDVDRDFAATDSVVAVVQKGKDPFAKRTGDMKRHYVLPAANEVMPYRLYVPTRYVASKSMPLIVALHGLGATEDSFFDQYGKKLPELAEQHGYILVAPLGYRVDGGYGSGVAAPPVDPVARRSSELSELDVMHVLADVRRLYNVDSSRIYLMGHSLGAIGTWKLAAKYPDIWAAIGPFAGQGAATTMERMKHIPAFVVHGDNDPTVNVRGSRTMVDAMKTHSVDFTYIEVPGGDHSNVVAPNFAGMMKFFDARTKGGRKSP
ncbi:MAG: PHB depolymerase family esterase [Gemmatimonas sp.]